MSTKDFSDVRVNLANGCGVVEIDGVKVSDSVIVVDVCAEAGKPAKVILSLLVHELMVDGEAPVTIPQKTQDALLALGWTAPTDAAAPKLPWWKRWLA